MLLQNFIKTMCTLAMRYTQEYSTTYGATTNKVRNFYNSTPFYDYSNTGSYNNIDLDIAGIAFGTDDTPPIYTDTQIKAPITSGLVDLSHQNSGTESIKTLTQTVRNDSEDTITVKEIGIFITNYYARVLLTRSIINVPILPGETKTFTISINYNKFSESYSAT